MFVPQWPWPLSKRTFMPYSKKFPYFWVHQNGIDMRSQWLTLDLRPPVNSFLLICQAVPENLCLPRMEHTGGTDGWITWRPNASDHGNVWRGSSVLYRCWTDVLFQGWWQRSSEMKHKPRGSIHPSVSQQERHTLCSPSFQRGNVQSINI